MATAHLAPEECQAHQAHSSLIQIPGDFPSPAGTNSRGQYLFFPSSIDSLILSCRLPCQAPVTSPTRCFKVLVHISLKTCQAAFREQLGPSFYVQKLPHPEGFERPVRNRPMRAT